MSKTRLSEEEVQKAYTDVQYEFWMLRETAALLRKSQLTRPAERAILESFVIHMRNLLDFLYKTPEQDDIAAEHFVPAVAWQCARPQLSAVIRDALKRAPKEVAHLTYTRLSASDKDVPWPIPAIVQEVSVVFNKFVELAIANHPSLAQEYYHRANTVIVESTVTSQHTTNCSTTLTLDTRE